MLQGNFMIITNRRKLSPIRRNSPQFTAIRRNLPQNAAKRRNWSLKDCGTFSGLTLALPFIAVEKNRGQKWGAAISLAPSPPQKNNFSGIFLGVSRSLSRIFCWPIQIFWYRGPRM
jgi:hypothetical protein